MNQFSDGSRNSKYTLLFAILGRVNLVGRFATVSNDDILAINKALVPKREKILILKFVK